MNMFFGSFTFLQIFYLSGSAKHFLGLIYSERSTVHVKSYEHLFQSGVVKAILLYIELTISFRIGRKHTVNL